LWRRTSYFVLFITLLSALACTKGFCSQQHDHRHRKTTGHHPFWVYRCAGDLLQQFRSIHRHTLAHIFQGYTDALLAWSPCHRFCTHKFFSCLVFSQRSFLPLVLLPYDSPSKRFACFYTCLQSATNCLFSLYYAILLLSSGGI